MAFIRNFVFIYAVTKYILIPIRKKIFTKSYSKRGTRKAKLAKSHSPCVPHEMLAGNVWSDVNIPYFVYVETP